MDALAIGIDLGTTNSCVALYINGKTKILENSDGGKITPSFIFFTSLQETIVGEHANRIASVNPENGIYAVKRLVGRKFNDYHVQNNMQYLPYRITSDSAANLLVVIEQRDKTLLKKTPLELCTIILKKLKSDAEAKLGQKIDKVVITVPAYFNVTQRKVTLKAAKKAGFTVLKLLNEPTAAALSYYFENDCNDTEYAFVYDLGGGTFDVAILKRSKNNIEILAVHGDTQLGGHDFDNLILKYVCEELMKDYGYDAKSDKDNMRRLQNLCEDAKKALSTVQETIITLIGFVPNHIRIQIHFTREQFENIAQDLFRRTVDIVDACMSTCDIPKSCIKEVILSGGSTRIPKVQTMISDYFNGKILNKFVCPDECVAEGAALQAAMLSNSQKQNIDKLEMIDVVPLSLGFDSLGGEMIFVINRYAKIPTEGSQTYATLEHNDKHSFFGIYEGERSDARLNRYLGQITITSLTPAPPGQTEIVMTLNIDHNGILTATAKEKYRNNVKKLTVNYTRGDVSEREIKNSLLDALENKMSDERFIKFVKYKRFLIKYCIGVAYNLDNNNLVEKYESIYNFCKETRRAANNLEMDQESRVKELIEECNAKCNSIVQCFNFKFMPILKV